MRTSLGNGCPVALLYRWKHVDRALGFAARASGQHDILSRALRLMWGARDLAAAEAEVDAAGAEDDLPYEALGSGFP